MATNWIPTPEQLVTIREGLGLEQKQMAGLLGIDPRNLRRKEKGEFPVTRAEARAIRDIAIHISLVRLGIPAD